MFYKIYIYNLKRYQQLHIQIIFINQAEILEKRNNRLPQIRDTKTIKTTLGTRKLTTMTRIKYITTTKTTKISN